jgi:hypothetical protein
MAGSTPQRTTAPTVEINCKLMIMAPASRYSSDWGGAFTDSKNCSRQRPAGKVVFRDSNHVKSTRRKAQKRPFSVAARLAAKGPPNN